MQRKKLCKQKCTPTFVWFDQGKSAWQIQAFFGNANPTVRALRRDDCLSGVSTLP
jgi:hypothetical protein